eukprot:403351444
MMIPAVMIANRVRDRSQLNEKSQTLTLSTLKPSVSSIRILNEDSTQSQFFTKRNSSLNHSNRYVQNPVSSSKLLQQATYKEDLLMVPSISQLESIKKTHSIQTTKQSQKQFSLTSKNNQTNNSIERLSELAQISSKQVALNQLVSKQNQIKQQQSKIDKQNPSAQENYSLEDISYLAATQTLGCSHNSGNIQSKCKNTSCSGSSSKQLTSSTCFDSRDYSKNESSGSYKTELSQLNFNSSISQESQLQKNESHNNYLSIKINGVPSDLNFPSVSLNVSPNRPTQNSFSSISQKMRSSSKQASPCKSLQLSENRYKSQPQNLQISKDFDPEYLGYHSITENQRLRMIDWMIQVFRVLGKQVTKTFVLATQIMDKFYLIKMLQGIKQNKADFHIVGLTSIFIASKYEDVQPIFMRQILNEASHGKYDRSQILNKEQDILQTLEFKIQNNSFYDEACEKMHGLIQLYNSQFQQSQKLNKQDRKDLFVLAGFFSQIVLHSSELSHQDIEILSSSIIYLTLKYYKNYSSAQLLQFMNGDTMVLSDKTLLIKINTAQQLYSKFKQGLMNKFAESEVAFIKQLRNRISQMFTNFQKDYPNQQNLYKNIPSLFSQDSIKLLSSQ